jgi:predicted O-methyltransferase YrrM
MSKILYTSQENYIKSFRNEIDELIIEMEEFAKKGNVPILTPDSAQFLEQLITIHKPKRALEIGCAIAYSTIRIAKNLKKKSVIDTIEVSKENIKKAKFYIDKSNVKDKINIIEGDALEVMPNLSNKYDFIFLDADKEDYEKLFYFSLMLLKKNGIILVDNLLWHGYAASSKVPPKFRNSTKHVRNFNNLFLSHPTLKSTLLPIGDGLGLGIKIK